MAPRCHTPATKALQETSPEIDSTPCVCQHLYVVLYCHLGTSSYI